MDELGFYIPSTVFQSFQDDGRVNMKGSVQYFNTDSPKAVILLWFLTVTCSCCPYLYLGSPLM